MNDPPDDENNLEEEEIEAEEVDDLATRRARQAASRARRAQLRQQVADATNEIETLLLDRDPLAPDTPPRGRGARTPTGTPHRRHAHDEQNHEDINNPPHLPPEAIAPRASVQTVVKLRMDHIPTWPQSKHGSAKQKFYQWIDQWQAAMALVGYGDIIRADLDVDVNPIDDATACRYLVASITNDMIASHIASNYAGNGRLALRWLEGEFGLGSMRQSCLRKELDEIHFGDDDDPRLGVILFDKVVGRLRPQPENKEKIDMLISKLGPRCLDLGSLIKAQACNNADSYIATKSRCLDVYV